MLNDKLFNAYFIAQTIKTDAPEKKKHEQNKIVNHQSHFGQENDIL